MLGRTIDFSLIPETIKQTTRVKMAVKMRLRRMGKKKQPIYRVVVAEARCPRDGRFIETLGQYNPRTSPVVIEIKEEQAIYWLKNGAQPTDTVKSLLVKTGIWDKFRSLKTNKKDNKEVDAVETVVGNAS